MKQHMTNSVYVTGKVFSINGRNERDSLAERTSRKGVKYISGTITISVSDDNTETVPVYFTYVREKTKSGNDNSTFTNLRKIIDDNRTVESVGNDEAQWVRLDGNLETNDFWSTRNNEFASPLRVRGGFVHEERPGVPYRNSFEVDSLIGSAIENDDDSVTLKAYFFDFRNAIMPADFQVHGKKAVNYFLDAGISNSEPMFTRLIGTYINREEHTMETVEDDDMAFGEDVQRDRVHTVRYWEITGASKPAKFDDESTITKAELKKALQDRQEYLEGEKQRTLDYQASRDVAPKTPAYTTTSDDDDFDGFPF